MTLEELHSESEALCFDDHLELDHRFIISCKRALESIYNSLHLTSKVRFFVKSSLPKTKISLLYHKGGGTQVLPLDGRAYSMRLYGKGEFTLYSDGKSQRRSFDSQGDVFRGFVGRDARICFGGELSYVICDLVTFDDVFYDDEESIPDGSGYTVVDMRRLVPDFLAFDSMPKDKSGRVIESSSLVDGKIIFAPEFVGEAEIVYRKRAIIPTLEAPKSEIDLPEEYEVLLTLMTASYLILDDDEERSAYFKEMYESELAEIKRHKRSLNVNKYVIADGWA